MTWINNRFSYTNEGDKLVLYKRVFNKKKYYRVKDFETMQELNQYIEEAR